MKPVGADNVDLHFFSVMVYTPGSNGSIPSGGSRNPRILWFKGMNPIV